MIQEQEKLESGIAVKLKADKRLQLCHVLSAFFIIFIFLII